MNESLTGGLHPMHPGTCFNRDTRQPMQQGLAATAWTKTALRADGSRQKKNVAANPMVFFSVMHNEGDPPKQAQLFH